MGKFTYIKYFLLNAPSSYFSIKVRKRFKSTKHFLKKGILSLEESSKYIEEKLRNNEPFCAVRFGGTELSCLNATEKIELGFTKTYSDKVRYAMKNNGGYYPTKDRHLNEFSHSIIQKAKYIDALGIVGLHMEDYFVKKYFSHATYLTLWALEPLMTNWSQALANKKVLVITPFADEVNSQYQKRELLFKGHPEILPQFDLQVLEAPLTLGDEVDERFPSSMRYLEEMQQRIKELDFDVALVGAGAYGPLLCMYIRSLNKSAIQTGGATQTLFGIIGKRWENRPHVAKYINEHWVRPLKRPKGYQKVDQGAYW